MTDRALLGAADVDDRTLTGMVADLLGVAAADVTLLGSTVEQVAYDVPALTTAGRHWVRVHAATPSGPREVRFFVKHVRAWHRHPFFEQVPVEAREMAAASFPWRTEPLAYRSGLRDALPAGLHMPRALGVFDLEDDAAAIWLEEVATGPQPWDLDRYRRAAHLLGRLAASHEVAAFRDVGRFDWTVDRYVHGRIGTQIAPVLLGDELWRHPAIDAAVDDRLRDRLRTAVRTAPDLVAELLALPALTAHGDASPNNLLPGPTPDSFTLIDYGFWMGNPVGFDLGQLLVGEVQLGRRSPGLLPETDEVIVAAYREGLQAEGFDISPAALWRAHALHLLLFTGVSALPFDELDLPPERLGPLARDRAALATYCLDLADATT